MNRKICALKDQQEKLAVVGQPNSDVLQELAFDRNLNDFRLLQENGEWRWDIRRFLDLDRLRSGLRSNNPLMRVLASALLSKTDNSMLEELIGLFQDENLIVRHVAARSAAVLLSYKRGKVHEEHSEKIMELRYPPLFLTSRIDEEVDPGQEIPLMLVEQFESLGIIFNDDDSLETIAQLAGKLHQALAENERNGITLARTLLLSKEELPLRDFAFALYLLRDSHDELFPYLAVTGLAYVDPDFHKLVLKELIAWSKDQTLLTSQYLMELLHCGLQNAAKIRSEYAALH